MSMNLQAFKAIAVDNIKEVHIKKINDKVKLKKLKPKTRTDIEFSFMNGIKTSDDLFNLKLKAIMESVIDDENNIVFTEKTKDVLINIDAEIMNELWQHIQEFNFTDGKEIEEQAKNSQSGL